MNRFATEDEMNATVNQVECLVLSTEEFEAAVKDVGCRVAVFDCDGTLWSGDAGSEFMRWSVETGLLGRKAAEWLNGRYQGYKRGEVSELAICGEMVQVYSGLRDEEMRAGAREFFRTRVEPHIFPEMRRVVDALQKRGAEIWTVSSTNHWVIEEGARSFGIAATRVLAARVEVEDGVVTGKLVDVPTDEGKAVSLRRAGVTMPDAVFGNSVHDAAMLRMARHAFPVNASPGLLELSTAAGWPVYYPESVRAV